MKKKNTRINTRTKFGIHPVDSGTDSVGKKKKIIYHDPPMKYNVALHKFEVNLPIIKKKSPKKDIQDSGATITVILIIILLIAAFYFISKIY